MIISVLKKTKELYKTNAKSLILYFGLYSVMIAVMNYGIGMISFRRIEDFLPNFLIAPLMLLLTKRCFELVVGKSLDSKIDVAKVYGLSAVIMLLPNCIKAFFPVIPYYGSLVAFLLVVAKFYATGLFFLCNYILILNPKIGIGQMIKISCKRMKGNIVALGVLVCVLLLWVAIPAFLMIIFVDTIFVIVLKVVVMALYMPYFLIATSIFASRILSNRDAKIKIDLSELDLKQFFEETVENGASDVVLEEIDVDFVEEFQTIYVEEKQKKVKPIKEMKREQPPKTSTTPVEEETYKTDQWEWNSGDQLDDVFFKAEKQQMPVKEETVRSTPKQSLRGINGFTELKNVKEYEAKQAVTIAALEEVSVREGFENAVQVAFLKQNNMLYESYRKALAGAVKKYEKSKDAQKYGAHFGKIEIEGNSFSWLIEIKTQENLILETIELYINNTNW